MKKSIICLIVSCFLLFSLTACSEQKQITDNTESGFYAASSEASADNSISKTETIDEEISKDIKSDVSVTNELSSGNDTADKETATSKSESVTSSVSSKVSTSGKAESVTPKPTESSAPSSSSAASKPTSAEKPSVPATSSTPSKPTSAEDLTASSKPLVSSGSSLVSQSSKPSNTPSVDNDSQKQEVLRLVNEERAKNGLAALSYRYDLQEAADIRAKETVTSFSHTRPDGRSCFTVLADAGVSYRSVGENIAYGYKDAFSVMNGWMNSSGHRANILKENFKGLAVGLYEQNNTKYWVQIFIQ